MVGLRASGNRMCTIEHKMECNNGSKGVRPRTHIFKDIYDPSSIGLGERCGSVRLQATMKTMRNSIALFENPGKFLGKQSEDRKLENA